MRRDIFFTGSWQRGIPTRILVVLVALWLCIAPQWHLCADHGIASGQKLSACCLRFLAEHPGAGPTQLHTDTRSEVFCLARYLQFFPLVSAATFVFCALSSLIALSFDAPLRVRLPFRAVFHASRGPPCFR